MARTAIGTRPAPFVPTLFRVRPVTPGVTRTRGSSARPAREQTCWDLRWTVDKIRGFRRFDRSSEAEAFAVHLQGGYALGQRYSPDAGRFLPNEVAVDAGMTVAEWTDHYWAWKWPTLQPAGRPELARYLNRVRGHFVAIEPEGADADAVRDYLLASFRSDTSSPPFTPQQEFGRALLNEGSMPLSSIGRAELEGFVERCRYHYRRPGTTVAAGTITRMAADLRQCWDRAVVERVITSNPWHAVRLRDTPAAASNPVRAADADLVLAPSQVLALAQACVDYGTWGEMSRAVVLVMGFCGLRPSEAVGLLVGDVEVGDPTDAWLTVRRARRTVQSKFLSPHEDADWGPLKSKAAGAARRVPIPTSIIPVLQAHLATRAGARPFDLVFERNGRPINLDMFGRAVWDPARRVLFPPYPELPASSPLQPKMARLRRHDLRHAACSLWLRAGVDIKVCQRWSGHSRLSVFLDIYQGLIPGHEHHAAAQINTALAASTTPPTT